MKSLSIIIPVINESLRLTWLLPYLEAVAPDAELIVVDGGSTDDSHEIALRFARVLTAERGRGVQMNRGAEIAQGDILWFVHADTQPRPDSVDALLQIMENPRVVGGAFRFCLDAPGLVFRTVEKVANLINIKCRLIYGEMGIFVRRSVFESLGGFAEIPLMEDMDFSRRLRKLGHIAILPQKIKTSPCRWLDEGFCRYAFKTLGLQIAWHLGFPAHKLARYTHFRRFY